MKLITFQWTQKRKKHNNNELTFSTKRFQTPTESQYAKARRKRKDSEGTHVRQVQTLIGWQQSPLGHQNLTCLFISSNISVVAISSNQSLRGNLHFTRLRVTSAFWSSIEDFSAYCPVLRGFIMLRPGHPLVFARMARWQSWSTTLYFTCFQFWEMSLIIPYFYLFKPLSSWKVFCLY